MFKEAYVRGYQDAFEKLGFRLDSGAANQRRILRQKYLDAGHDKSTADTYSQSAAQKLWNENRATGGVPGYHKAVQSFQAPKPGSWVSPEETERHMQNPAVQAAMLAMASRQQKHAAFGQFVKNVASRAKILGGKVKTFGQGAVQGLEASVRENPSAWAATGGTLATTGALGAAAYGMNQKKKQQQALQAPLVPARA